LQRRSPSRAADAVWRAAADRRVRKAALAGVHVAGGAVRASRPERAAGKHLLACVRQMGAHGARTRRQGASARLQAGRSGSGYSGPHLLPTRPAGLPPAPSGQCLYVCVPCLFKGARPALWPGAGSLLPPRSRCLLEPAQAGAAAGLAAISSPDCVSHGPLPLRSAVSPGSGLEDAGGASYARPVMTAKFRVTVVLRRLRLA
jgi:hypothetical protein